MIFTVTVALAMQLSFSFRGGSVADLSAKMEAFFSKPTVILVNRSQAVPKLSVHSETRSGLLAQIAEKTKSTINGAATVADPSGATHLAIAPSAWPIDLYYRGYFRSDWMGYERADWLPPVDISKDDKVSLHMKGAEFATMEDVREALLSAGGYTSVRWHWFFDKVELGISCTAIERPLLVKAIAQCIGAKVQQTGTDINFELDPKVFRERVIALEVADPKSTLFSQDRRRIDAHVYRLMSDRQIETVWRSSEGFVALPVPADGEGRELADAYLRERAKSDNTILKEAAAWSIGKPAQFVVTTNGAALQVMQADGKLVNF